MTDFFDKKMALVEKLKSKKGRAAAVNAMCCECIYDPEATGSGSWRKQVEDCTSQRCPLYPYRPLTTGGKDEDETITEGVNEDGA